MPQRARTRSSRAPRRLLLRFHRIAALTGALLATATPLLAASLQPTHAALLRQSRSAHDAGLAYLDDDQQVHDFVRRGLLVSLRGNADYYIHPDVRHAAARPELKVFVERLADQYRGACDERLVVTSLVRPRSRQPWNSDPLSVHPTGMAVDLRISASSKCRRWLEGALLDLEDAGMIEAARERVVPHYHVVVFPAYADHLERRGVDLPASAVPMLARSTATGPGSLASAFALAGLPPVTSGAGATPSSNAAAVERTTAPSTPQASVAKKKATTARRSTDSRRYKVRRGDNLWSIARRHGVTVAAIRRANRVPRTLQPGHVLTIPAR